MTLFMSKGLNNIVCNEEIMEHLWPDSYVTLNSILQIIHSTKKVLHTDYEIVNMRNKGYMLMKK